MYLIQAFTATWSNALRMEISKHHSSAEKEPAKNYRPISPSIYEHGFHLITSY
jgi:hypothetical protein